MGIQGSSKKRVQEHLNKTLWGFEEGEERSVEKALNMVKAEIFIDGQPVDHSLPPDHYLAILVTNKKCYVMDISQGTDDAVVMSKEFNNMSRLVKGFLGQVLYIGWIESEHRESFMTVVCHKESDRNELLGTLHALSTPEGGTFSHRVPLQPDTVFKEAVDGMVTEGIVLSVFAESLADKSRQSMFLLSEGQLYEFDVFWKNWAPPYGEKEADSDGEHHSGDEAMIAAAGRSALQEKKGTKNHARPAQSTKYEEFFDEHTKMDEYLETKLKEVVSTRATVREEKNNKQRAAHPTEDLMKTLWHKPLAALKLIAFHPDVRPRVQMEFGEESVIIQFFDDDGREAWRRALMSQISRTDTKNNWIRHFSQSPPTS